MIAETVAYFKVLRPGTTLVCACKPASRYTVACFKVLRPGMPGWCMHASFKVPCGRVSLPPSPSAPCCPFFLVLPSSQERGREVMLDAEHFYDGFAANP